MTQTAETNTADMAAEQLSADAAELVAAKATASTPVATDPQRGLHRVREDEVKYLSWLADSALTEAVYLVGRIDSAENEAKEAALIADALNCISTAEHYLRLLGDPTGS